MEDQVDGFGFLGAGGGGDVRLVLAEELRVQFHVSGLVDAVHVSETGGDAEVGGYGGEGLVDVEDVFGLGVEGVVVDVFVVDAVFFAAGDADFLGVLVSVIFLERN